MKPVFCKTTSPLASRRFAAIPILIDIFLKSPEEVRKLDEEDITLKQYIERMNVDMPVAVFNFLAFFANMAMVEPYDLVSAAEYMRIAQDSFNNGGGGYPEGSMMRISAGIHPTVLKLVGEEHFDAAYVERVKNLQPAWRLTSQIYFLSEPVLDFDIAIAYSADASLAPPGK